ncbi:unnamed protein product [Rhizoctonia solani]|uniref:Rho1 guanine nucleotide exchange factor 1 [Schizosaccharomyces pombe 972h-] n=1 Tax=Rhizoctonia solani TaxID=456999 RepID=A0A8H3DLU4_9AGAM|nr:unnamed protein product [Rhizoctonia solani]
MATPPIEEKGASGKSEAKTFDLAELDELLLCKDGKHDLKLKDPRRRLIHQGSLNYKSRRKEYSVFLLDHVLIVTKPKVIDGRERLRIIDHPIPIQLLRVSSEQTRSTIFGCVPLPLGKIRHQLRFSSLGKRFNNGKALALLTPTAEASKTWVETIDAQQNTNQQNTEPNVLTFGQDMLMENGDIRVSCATLYDNGQTIAYGTDDGVYLQPLNGRPRKAVDLTGVRQIAVLEDISLLVVLSDRSVFTFPLDALDQFDRMKRMNRVTNGQTSFFKAGTCMDRTMVCLAKTTSTSSTVKILERVESMPEPNPNRKVQTLLPDMPNKLKAFKEFYSATELYSIQFLKTKLCAAGATGFEIIDLETLDAQVLLDPSDNALGFVRQHKNPGPLGVYRIGNEFLVCYKEFAFYVNKNGWKSDKDMVIYWEGTPTACALQYPYIVAFSSKFVEIRHVDDGSLLQVIHEADVRCLYAECTPLWTNAEDPALQSSQQSGEKSILVSFANQVKFLTPSSQ